MILLKPHRLTLVEKTEINLHPVMGGNIMKSLRFFLKMEAHSAPS
jgi:HD-GYP domain-containing protein (c-di-GMP phosphodiesterase class II)